MSVRWRIPLVARAGAAVLALVAIAVCLALALIHWLPDDPLTAGALALLIMVPLVLIAVRSEYQPMLAMFRALGGTVISYRDGDYSFGLHWPRNDELGDLIAAHNELGTVLREQRLDLIQRELLLDTMVQNTPVAMLLIADRGAVVFANLAARQLLNQGRRLEGNHLDDILEHTAASLREAIARGGDGLFTVPRTGDAVESDEDETYHLSRRQFTLNGRRHELLLLRHLTAELRRQEVQTWKKVIRVISHELNNSLAPVTSLAHSGRELLKRGQPERLPEILGTIADRTHHLENFIAGYARFAKLPAPRRETIHWHTLIDALAAHITFRRPEHVPDDTLSIDIAQMEQALINLLKNAHESGSPPGDIALNVRRLSDTAIIEVLDRGSGMSETVMAHALVPFYSTKRSGTGLGLALAREIAEAHGGRITISNREGGGLAVALILPT
jgi:nitrogen fixation/metabolism regulation signal transduction histidine kinase